MLTAEGFKRKRYADFIAEMESDARAEFGADVNLSDSSPLGKLLKLWAFARAEENELAEALYYSVSYLHAEGVVLDYVVKNQGITRLGAEKAKKDAALKITCNANQTIAAGFLIETEDGIAFQTTAATTADGTGTAYANLEALVAGVSGNVPANTITTITTPIAGVTAVTNVLALEGGRNAETDAELRSRYELSIGKAGESSLNGIRAKLLNDVPGVRAAIVIENDLDVADADGRPPHSVSPVVLGGTPDDIANAIFNAKAGAIRSYGSQVVTVTDDSGNPHSVGFSYADEVEIYINLDLTTDASFPSNGNDMVKLEIVKYIGGNDLDGNFYTGLGMSDDVILFQIEKAIGNVPGIVDASVTLSKDNVNFSASNISIGKTEVAQTSFDKVVIS